MIREQQARDLSLGWLLLRRCTHRLDDHLTAVGALAARDDVFFLTRVEVSNALPGAHGEAVPQRRADWERHRCLPAPLTIGTPTRPSVTPSPRPSPQPPPPPAGALVGRPASAGRATGRVRVIHGPADFAAFTTGEVQVAQATAPAWTPLFAQAAAVVTDGGTLAAHASLVAREYGIPAVVGIGSATSTQRTGQPVTVDGTLGVVIPTPAAVG